MPDLSGVRKDRAFVLLPRSVKAFSRDFSNFRPNLSRAVLGFPITAITRSRAITAIAGATKSSAESHRLFNPGSPVAELAFRFRRPLLLKGRQQLFIHVPILQDFDGHAGAESGAQ